MPHDLLSRLAALRAERTPAVLATVVASLRPQSARAGAKAIVLADGTVEGWFGGGCVRPLVVREALDALERGEPVLVRFDGDAAHDPGPHDPGPHDPGPHDAGATAAMKVYPMTCQGEGGLTVFLDPMLPEPALVVVGATPVARAIVDATRGLGFHVRVAECGAIDDPEVEMANDLSTAMRALGPRDVVVVATMGTLDEDALVAATASDAGRVALVASRKKGDYLVDFARAHGASPDRLARVKYPAGLDLGATTPEEIGVSIAAELIAWRHARADVAAPAPAPRPARALALAPLATDPVCGMQVDPAGARHSATHAGHTYHFCCARCQAAFERDPASYAGARA